MYHSVFLTHLHDIFDNNSFCKCMTFKLNFIPFLTVWHYTFSDFLTTLFWLSDIPIPFLTFWHYTFSDCLTLYKPTIITSISVEAFFTHSKFVQHVRNSVGKEQHLPGKPITECLLQTHLELPGGFWVINRKYCPGNQNKTDLKYLTVITS